MSDILNHYYCGRQVLEKIDKQNRDIITPHIKLYDLGTQGPDFFFYDGALPWQHDTGMPHYGSLLHRDSADKLFKTLLDICLNQSEPERSRMWAYICGFICHHALDVATHPYINYISGIYDETDKNTHKYKHCHKKVEVALDIAHTLYIGKKPAPCTAYYEIFNMSKKDIETVYNLYEKAIKELYTKEITIESISKCLNDAYRTNKLTCDKTGIKKHILTLIEKIVAKEPYPFTKAVYTKTTGDTIDYLNLKHTTWRDPCDDTKEKNDTYLELFSEACIAAANHIKSISETGIDKQTEELIHEVFGDESFETGRPWNAKDKLKYSRCILPVK